MCRSDNPPPLIECRIQEAVALLMGLNLLRFDPESYCLMPVTADFLQALLARVDDPSSFRADTVTREK